MRPKCHSLLLDEEINGRRGVAFNVFQMFLIGAMKLCAHAEEAAALRSARTVTDSWTAMVSSAQCCGSAAEKPGYKSMACKRRRIHRSVAVLAKRSRPKFVLDCISDVVVYTLDLVKRRCDAVRARCWLTERKDAVRWLCLRAFERAIGNGRGKDLEYTDVANGLLSRIATEREELERRWDKEGHETAGMMGRNLRGAASDARNAALLGSVCY